VLEVGMGGRLDAVNLFDTDIAVITPVGLDHMAWLGDNREKIGREKAGIMRADKPVVCSETQPPQSVLDYADKIQAKPYVAGAAFSYDASQQLDWSWQNENKHYLELPLPALLGKYQLQNAAAILQVCDLLSQQGMQVDETAIRRGLQQVRLAGRFQLIPGSITRILDVTHNHQGAENLRQLLTDTAVSGKTYAVLAMLKDKDCDAVAETLNSVIDFWYLAGLDGDRGLSSEKISEVLTPIVGNKKLGCYQQVADAYHAAMGTAVKGDRILIFGSFHTVEAVMREMPEIVAPVSAAS